MEKARAEYEKVKAHQSPEKAVSLKGEVETARGASAAMADNGNHSNRGQEARSEDGRVTLKGEAQASRAASEKLAEGRDTGSPALDDHSIV